MIGKAFAVIERKLFAEPHRIRYNVIPPILGPLCTGLRGLDRSLHRESLCLKALQKGSPRLLIRTIEPLRELFEKVMPLTNLPLQNEGRSPLSKFLRCGFAAYRTADEKSPRDLQSFLYEC